MQKRKDIIMVRIEELGRLDEVHRVMDKHITRKEAASNLSLSERQVWKIVRRVRFEGDRG